jgi:hypothetical protein
MLWMLLILVIIIIYFIIKQFSGSIKNSAVQNAFLAKFTYDTLNDQERREVQNKVIEILMRSGPPTKEFQDWVQNTYRELNEMHRFSIMALAMAEINIQPGLQNETWHYVKRPFQPIENAEYQIKVFRHHLLKHHNVQIYFS